MIFLAGGNAYTLAHEHKNGWNAEAFKERYSEVLERYDYIVGDWGYNQLRLRGFYQDGHPRATKETTIASLVDYLNEYCNFGCAYFVLNKTDAAAVPPGTRDLIQPAAAEPQTAAAEESDAQTAETAASSATHNGILMRWPLKERPGGPVRVPGAAAMARAAAEAERRQQQANAKPADGRPSPSGRQGSDGGFAGRQAGRPSSGGVSDRKPSGSPNAGQADGRSGGKPGNRGPRPQSSERQGGGSNVSKPGGQWRQPAETTRPAEPRAAESDGQKPDASKNASRWPGKNRRRNRFGGKPNRPDGTARDGGAPGHPGNE